MSARLTNDVDTAHLLSNHDSERRQGRASHSRNCKEFDEASEVVALADDILLDLDLRIDVV